MRHGLYCSGSDITDVGFLPNVEAYHASLRPETPSRYCRHQGFL